MRYLFFFLDFLEVVIKLISLVIEGNDVLFVCFVIGNLLLDVLWIRGSDNLVLIKNIIVML